ncbi:MAG TPA: stage V sporulation protein AB [Candidatus Atribacteria bacterium]|nr:stage V sporulation protein AB [Candidatus Atribacteria bacterium]HPT78795.1 stage V sporulation protein AB [Candidatus Atribacteria bacterium]
MRYIISVLTALAGGLAVGAAVVAFLTVLGVIIRIVELTGESFSIRWYQTSIILGSLFSCAAYFLDPDLSGCRILAVPAGLVCGIYIGMIAAALTETFDILTVAADTFSIVRWIYLLVWTVVLGKIIGSVIFFMY